ncbi:MAG: serine/threonine protein kinase [Proteobacteria bacterium]|nr:serine/threonine protein kinase [Pseudomonadota bacterium]
MKKKFGHYEVISELGRGGMGVVYKAWEPSLNRHVAIKALGEHLLSDEALIERFTREAKSMASINHPNVIQVYFIGKEQGQPYFAMEFIDGVSLDELLKGQKVLALPHAKEILRQSCAGLAVAHHAGLVHRDIKPANLMVCDDGTIKVVDFGIAQTREYGDKLTNTGEFVGTPGYLSPEVCTGQDVDARSDIFALGIVFYEMLAGKVPFENESPLGLMLEVVQADIPDIRTINKKVDKKTSYILGKMIAKNVQERFQNCDEVVKQLGSSSIELNLKEIQSQASVAKIVNVKSPVSNQITMQAIETLDRQKVGQRKNKAPWLLVAMVFVVAGATAFGFFQGYIKLTDETMDEPVTLLSAENTASQIDEITEKPVEIQQETLKVEHIAENQTQQTEAGFVIQQQQDLSDEITSDSVEQITISDQSLLDDTSNKQFPVEVAKGQLVNDETQSAEQQTTKAQNKEVEALSNDENTIAYVELAKPETQYSSQTSSYVEQAKPLVLNKGVTVLVFGDPAVANPIEKILEAELRKENIKVLNEQFVPGLSALLNQGMDLAAIRDKLISYGGSAMVIANVNYIGEQSLQYYGRSTQLINTQLDVDSYDLKTGDSIGNGYGAKLSYTSLNATEKAQEVLQSFVDDLKTDIKNK